MAPSGTRTQTSGLLINIYPDLTPAPPAGVGRQVITAGAFGPAYRNETGTRQSIALNAAYINETQ